MSLAIVVLGMVNRAAADDPLFVPRQALVRLVPGSSIESFNAQYGTVVLESMAERSIYLVALPEDPNEEVFVEMFDADPSVLIADLNYFAEDTDADGTTQDIFLARTFLEYQADPAFEIIGSSSAHIAARGEGVIVAIIDTGLDPLHPMLSGRIAPGGYNFIDNNADFSDVGPGSFTGHGSMIAGIVLRVAPESRVLPLRVLDPDGSTTTFRLARAIFHAIDSGASIINISLGTTADPLLLQDAVAEAAESGVLIIAAAGNDDAQSPARSPAGLSSLGVIAVAATDLGFVKAPFSNYGSWISIAAPGTSIHGPVPGGGYGESSGTSFASPLVAGVAAIIRSRCPDAAIASIRAHLLDNTVPLEEINPSYPGMLGTGGLDAEAAVAAAVYAETACLCPADFDGSESTDVPDIFAFLRAWFELSPLADADRNAEVAVTDIFAFLSLWFAGCN